MFSLQVNHKLILGGRAPLLQTARFDALAGVLSALISGAENDKALKPDGKA